jgi:hypothetical protein
MVRSAQPVHQSCTYTNTVSKRTEMRFHMTHVTKEFNRVRLKQFSSVWYVQRKPCTFLVSRLTLSPNGPNEFPLEPRHLGVPSSVSIMISEPMVLWRKPCTYLAPILTLSQTGQNEIPHDPSHLGVPSGASTMIYEPIVRSAQNRAPI